MENKTRAKLAFLALMSRAKLYENPFFSTVHQNLKNCFGATFLPVFCLFSHFFITMKGCQDETVP